MNQNNQETLVAAVAASANAPFKTAVKITLGIAIGHIIAAGVVLTFLAAGLLAFIALWKVFV